MASLFAEGAALLRSTADAGHTSVEVTVSHEGFVTETIKAVVGTTKRELQDSSGAIFEWESTDFVVAIADLVLNGRQVEPQRGMRITRADTQEVFEVQSPGNEQPWQWHDSAHLRMRVHTAKVKQK